MAIHTDLPSMAKEAIDEYVAVAKYCVTTQKPTGGVYGYPAVMLLFSLIDVFSNYAGYPDHSFGAMKDIFPGITDAQTKQLAKWYRHLTSHQAVIMPGTQLSVSEGDPIELNSAGEPTHIRVRPFYEALESFWAKFDANQVKPKFIAASAPLLPISIDVSNTLSASGANFSCFPTTGTTKTKP